MSTRDPIRRHLITQDPVLFAPYRAARPHAFGEPVAEDERCPFCAGHESDTPPPAAVTGDPWQIRVVPNKYPPVSGAEVIVESPDHGATFESLSHAAEVVGVYADRFRAHSDAASVVIFKNEGARAGSSIPHLHSQLIPLPFVPPRIAREAAAFASAGRCPLCIALETHRDGLVIDEGAHFSWLTPFSSTMPWQQWIVPKRHAPDFSTMTERERGDLASLLRAAARAMRSTGDAFNWIFINFPGRASSHWYVDLFPRLTTLAGFEIGTGTFVEIIDPAAAARRFREFLR